MEQLGKNPQSYESVYNATSLYEQKPMKTDDFTRLRKKKLKNALKKGK